MNKKSGILSIIFSLIQILLLLLGAWLFVGVESEGMEGLGYQVVIGGLFLLFLLANMVTLTVHLYRCHKEKVSPNRVAIVLFLLVFVLWFLILPQIV